MQIPPCSSLMNIVGFLSPYKELCLQDHSSKSILNKNIDYLTQGATYGYNDP